MRFLIALLLLTAAAPAQTVLVLSPDEFQPALAEWKAHREAQGYTVRVAAPGDDPRATVLKLRTKDLKFVLLLGDVKQVPAHVYPATIIKRWERDPRVYNDNHTADLDGDDIPDVAVGRLPADNVEEARTMLGKVIAYEKNRDYSAWRRRINVVAGVGGFGVMQDAAIERASTSFLKENIPASYDLHVTYANLKSAYCPPPSKVLEITTERMEEGALFFAYIGHGWRGGFDTCRFKGERYPIFTEDAAWELESKHGMPIVFLLCCSTGHFDDAPDCIAEVMVKRPKGPVAVIASSRVSMPYGNAPLAKELLEALFMDRQKTLGEAFLAAKIRTMTPKDPNDPQRALIETLAMMAYERDGAKRRQERIEHLYLYNLLGDPSLRIAHAASAALKAPETLHPGETAQVTVQAEVTGKYAIELVRERSPDRTPRTGDTDEEFMTAYRNANDGVLARAEGTAEKGAFGAALALPATLRPGTYDVRVWIEGDDGVAMGSQRVTVAATAKPAD
jgi:hypothetical protein